MCNYLQKMYDKLMIINQVYLVLEWMVLVMCNTAKNSYSVQSTSMNNNMTPLNAILPIPYVK